MALDLLFFQIINGLSRSNGLLDWLAIFWASYVPYILLLIAIWLLFQQKDRMMRLFIFFSFILSTLLSWGIIGETIRFFYGRLRPFAALNIIPLIKHSPSNSFPSGHMTFYFVLALTVFMLSKKWGWFFVINTGLMGLARIMVGVHWPSDILGGILIAAFSCWIVQRLLLPEIKLKLIANNK